MSVLKTATDDTLRETILHGDIRYPFAFYLEDIWQFDFHCIDWHWHNEFEFVYVREGTALCSVGSEKTELQSGFGIFINSGTLHRFEAYKSTIIPNIVFSPALLAPEESLIYEKYIRPVIRSATPYMTLSPDIKWQDSILILLKKVFMLQESEYKNELCTLQFLLQIFDIMTEHSDFSSGSRCYRQLNSRQAKLQLMMQYIQGHYEQDLSLDQIAESAALSISGALHIFQSAIHIPPVAYLIQYRLKLAAQQLRTTEKPVSSIAEETGFRSSGYFCRKFRQHYHMTPNKYRKMKTEKQILFC